MRSRWLIAVALGGVAAVASTASTASTAQSLNNTVTPGKPMSGPVRLSFENAYLSYETSGPRAGQYRASVSKSRPATVFIKNLKAPASVVCDLSWAESSGTKTFHVREFHGPALASTGKSHEIKIAPSENLEFIADPDPAGDYAYEIEFAIGVAQKFYSCRVSTL
ncbi:MAG: hypothetical protein AAF721_00120 [Myxococcota bacterium]